MPSIRAHLTVFFVISLAVATGVVAFVAQRIAHGAVQGYAVSILQSDALGKREAILATLERHRTAGASFLENTEANCDISSLWNVVCAREALHLFAAEQQARCAVLRTRGIALSSGQCHSSQPMPAMSLSFAADGSSYLITTRNASFGTELQAEYPSSELEKILGAGGFGVTSSTLLLDSGQTLSAPSKPRFNAALDCSSTDAQEVAGRHFMVRSVPLPVLRGCIISYIPVRQALAPSFDMRRTSWLMVAAFVLAAVLIAYAAATVISRSVARLTDRAESLQRGDFDSPIPISGPSEVRRLGETLSEAAAGLKIVRRTEIERERAVAAAGMAASLAHQINNPLTSVTSALSLLEPSVQDAAGRKVLSFAVQDAQRMAMITRQLVALHRQSTSPGLVELSGLLRNIIEQQRAEFSSRRVSIRDELTTATINGFESELRQAFDNILRNAMTAASPGTAVVIRCGLAHDLRPPFRSGARVTIHDVGRGLEPSLRSRLMQPFISSSRVKGKGLGVFVANAAVQKHNGRMHIRSGPGHTSVSIFLPHM